MEGVMQPFDKGDWVAYADYADLQAENERLTRLQVETLNERNKAEAENERLRKAGDAMASKIRYESEMADDDWGVDTGTPETVKAWLAAKGGQS
jgi:hypothetical protein